MLISNIQSLTRVVFVLIYTDFYFQADTKSYLSAFGKLRFQNELHELRRKLPSEWHAKLNKIEEAVLRSGRNETDELNTYVKVYKHLCIPTTSWVYYRRREI